MAKIKLQLEIEEASDVLKVLEKEVSGYSLVHVPERISRLRSVIEKLKN
jgi:hypothetical protein